MPTAPSGGGSLAKAEIVLVQPPKDLTATPQLSQITSTAKGGGGLGRIPFMFNPASYTVSKGAKWNRAETKGAKTVAMPEFVGSLPASMTLEILIDHSDRATPTVASTVDLLLSAVVPIPGTLDQGNPTPPWAVFSWGSRIPMVAFVSNVSATYTLFRPDGTPVRAKCSVTLEEVPTDPMPKQNPTSGSDRPIRQHTVVAGDSLPSIAQAAYGDAARWRDVADANGIDDPLHLPAGTSVLLPHEADLPELAVS
jgi:LysM repeat protein